MKKEVWGILLGEPFKTSETACRWVYPGIHKSNHFYRKGLFLKNDDTVDLTGCRFLSFEAEIRGNSKLTVKLGLLRDRSPGPEDTFFTSTSFPVTEGNKNILVPIDHFDLPASQIYHLQFCREVDFSADQEIAVSNIRFLKGAPVTLECRVRSRAAEAGQSAVYPLKVINCTNEKIHIELFQKLYGWETMTADIEPSELTLPAYGQGEAFVRVRVSDRVAPGGYERQIIMAAAEDSGGMERLQLITCRSLPYPHVLIDRSELEKIKEKIKRFGWPKQTFDFWKKYADEWEVPDIDPEKPYLFLSENSERARVTAYLYALTGEKPYAEKVVGLLTKVGDPQKGYRRLPKFTHQELVHEGECFRNLAIAYDLVHECGLFTPGDHENVEETFRLFIRLIDRELQKGEISNWTLAETAGALYCACALQDGSLINRFLFGVGGAAEHLSRGVLNDGWWYEASIGYNLMSAGLLTEMSQVVSHFGINFADIRVPASYAKSVNSASPLKDGLCHEVWGPNNKNYRCIKMLWDSLIPYFDYRGVIFGINDSIESGFEGITKRFEPRYDIAYYIYRDPAYAQRLKTLPPEKRDLLFGEGEFPPSRPDARFAASACSDNAGVAVLRSRAPERRQREQIQVVLKYGSHGGAHGHYDRASITSLMRYGRSLYNPENVWYSYHTYLYKFYVQNSVTHNMVTVDLKQQDPAEPKRTLFYSGNMIQACAVENFGKWCNPPYGGWRVDDDPTFQLRTWHEGRSIEIPENHPEYSARSGYTENVLTRRLVLVTDDYVLVCDSAEGREEHRYDCLYHLQGLKSIAGAGGIVRHTEKLEDDPLSSAQFITDCDWYRSGGGAKLHFEAEYTGTKNNGSAWLTKNRTGLNERGLMKSDLYLLCPSDGELAVGFPPEFEKVNKQLFYRVEADGETLASGRFGAWIFGRDHIDADLKGKKALKLAVTVHDVDFEAGFPQYAKDTIFWGDPCFVTESGKTISLSELDYTALNTKKGFGTGIDYEGGPVKIQTRPYPKAIPAEPEDRSREGVITINLEGLNAVRFRSDIGGDYPVGDEEERRRTVAFRSRGKTAFFLTLLEMYEEQPVVKSARCDDGLIQVDLADGRTQSIAVTGLEQEKGAPRAEIKEYKNGRLIRTETTVDNGGN